jgi:hypothetical protein
MNIVGKSIYAFISIILLLPFLCNAADQPFKGWDKLDLRSKQFVENNSNNGATAEVIIKTTEPINNSHKKAFKKTGFQYRTVINNIVTGSIPFDKISKVAGLEFVEIIELAVPLNPK